VTHDRYLLDRVSTIVLGLAGGKAQTFADYSQWAADKPAPKPAKPEAASPGGQSAPQKKKLSYLESREYESIGLKIPALEGALDAKRTALQEAALKDSHLLEQMYREIETSQQEIDVLYARWLALEEKAR
jgi:ABC transport system ATP-binding/permease protein